MNKEKEIERIKKIIKTIPAIKTILGLGGKWNEIKFLCEPLGLNDTAFRDDPTIVDYLLDKEHWKKRLEKIKKEKPLKKLTVIVNVNLEYTFEAKNADEAIEQAEDVDLPKQYVEDSFKLVKVLNENNKVIN